MVSSFRDPAPLLPIYMQRVTFISDLAKICPKNLSERQVFGAALVAKVERDGDFYCRFAP